MKHLLIFNTVPPAGVPSCTSPATPSGSPRVGTRVSWTWVRPLRLCLPAPVGSRLDKAEGN